MASGCQQFWVGCKSVVGTVCTPDVYGLQIVHITEDITVHYRYALQYFYTRNIKINKSIKWNANSAKSHSE